MQEKWANRIPFPRCKSFTIGPFSLQKIATWKLAMFHTACPHSLKTRDVSSDEKNREVSGRTAHAQFTRSTIASADADIQPSTYCIRNSDMVARMCGSHVSKIVIFLLCAFSLQNTLRSFALWLAIFRAWNLVQLLGNFHPNFASFQAQWEWPSWHFHRKWSYCLPCC